MNQTRSHIHHRRVAITAYMLNMGGVSNFILELGIFLKSAGYDVTIICTDRRGNWFDRIREEGLKGSYFNSMVYERVPFGRILLARKIGRYLRRSDFDFIINNHSFYVHAAAGYFFANTRIVHVIHNQLEQMVELESDPVSDKVVGVSPRIEELAREHLPAAQVTAILNGIKLPGEFISEYANCSDRPEDVLFVGRIDNRQKAVFLIPDIMEYLQARNFQTRITMLGDGPDFQKLKQIVEDRSLSEYIHLRGEVAPGEVSSFYATHKILLLPSNFEGHPLTLMEAMAHGCVPVSSLLPKCTDTCVEQGHSGYLVEVGNATVFGQGILDLLSNEEFLDQMSKNALERARNHFSQGRTHQKYLELLKSFEGNKMPRGRFPLLNRKYISWKEMVPFQLVMYVKRNILKSI